MIFFFIILIKQVRVHVYPEGTRTMNTNELQPFKKGAFITAIQLQLPIYPIVFSQYYFVNDIKRIFEFDGKDSTSTYIFKAIVVSIFKIFIQKKKKILLMEGGSSYRNVTLNAAIIYNLLRAKPSKFLPLWGYSFSRPKNVLHRGNTN